MNRRALILLFVLLLAFSVTAQDNTPIPACTDAELEQVNSAASEIVSSVRSIQYEFGSAYNPADLKTLHDLQTRWWSETQPALPRCAQAVDTGLMVGQLLDETMLSMLLYSAGEDNLALAHTGRMVDFAVTLNTLLGQPGEPTAAPAPTTTTYYVNSSGTVNIRGCDSTSCAVVGTASRGDALQVVDDTGDWYKVNLANGSVGYIAAFLVSKTQPASQPVVQPTNRPAAQATAIPQQAQPTNAPAPVSTVPPPPVSTQPPAPAYACDCSKACGAMASCEEAYFQLNQCGCSRRDGDHDGVPCEDICPGG